MRRAGSVVALLACVACCPQAPPPPPPGSTPPAGEGPSTGTAAGETPAPPPTGTAPAPPSPQAAARWLGAWSSPRCGERGYERWLTLSEGGAASGQDRVSPCPPGTACVWSGIVAWKGSWRLEGQDVVLSLTPDGPSDAAKALPERLVWDAQAAAPAEVQGEQRCVYQRRAAEPAPP